MHAAQLRCQTCPVRTTNICSALDDSALISLEKMSRKRTVKAHEVIFHDGDLSNQYFNVKTGAIKLIKTLGDGRQHIVGLLYPPDFMGQCVNTHHTYSAETAIDTELCSYPRGAFDLFLTTHPELERKIFNMTLRELDSCRDWSLLLGRKCSYERVAGFLLMIAKRMQDGSPEGGGPGRNGAHFQLPFTRGEMADYLGLTLETVSRQFSRLKGERVISLPSSRVVIIPDIDMLGAVANVETCSKPSMRQRKVMLV